MTQPALVRFANYLIPRDPCCLHERLGQDHLLTCTVTGVQMLWSPTEAGTLDAAMAEHMAAHNKADEDRAHRERSAFLRACAWNTYRTTEPGDPARRGIGAYL